MCGGLFLSSCPHNLHGHERTLKEEKEVLQLETLDKVLIFRSDNLAILSRDLKKIVNFTVKVCDTLSHISQALTLLGTRTSPF